MAETLRTEAWLLMGITGSIGGVLQLADGNLSFTASGSAVAGVPLMLGRQLRALEQKAQRPGLAEKLKNYEGAQVFDAPLDQVSEVVFPWYYFGNGASLTVGGARFRFSFAQPQNAKSPSHSELEEIIGAGGDLARGRQAGEAWKAALSARM